jgi:hypothetical protein
MVLMCHTSRHLTTAEAVHHSAAGYLSLYDDGHVVPFHCDPLTRVASGALRHVGNLPIRHTLLVRNLVLTYSYRRLVVGLTFECVRSLNDFDPRSFISSTSPLTSVAILSLE